MYGQQPLKMRFKLFANLIVFVFVVLVLLWALQVFLLDTFFYQVTKNRMISAADRIEEMYQKDPRVFPGRINSIALNNEFCVSVFGKDGRLITTADIGSGCIIHNTNDQTLNELYQKALESGGEYFHRAGLSGFNRKQTGDQYDVRDRILYASVRNTEVGTLILLFDAPSSPVSIIKGVMIVQLIMVTIVLTVIAALMANSLAKNLSQPIADVNRAAKKLVAGEYDVKFTGAGYREIYELSETLNQTAKDLKRTEQMQKELIANISHDLRTPLTLITGYCEMMRDIEGENNPENMQVVLDETARLSSLVNDLIELSKYENGTQNYTLESVDLDFLLLETVERYRKLLAEKEYTILYESVGPTFVQCDKKRILQVVYNLVSNAINYAGEDKTVILRLTDGENGRKRVEIIDHGAGIAKEDLPLIFDRYYKVDKTHSRAVTGTGLGLSIVKNILEGHGAVYGVQSELGKGSIFYFEL